jgi:hypothetical protein
MVLDRLAYLKSYEYEETTFDSYDWEFYGGCPDECTVPVITPEKVYM